MREVIGKQRYLVDFALSSLFRRKAKNGALLFAFTVIVFALASVMFFTHALKKEAAFLLAGSPDMIVQRMTAGRQDLVPLSYLKQVRMIRGVSAASGRLWGYYFDPGSRANYTLLVSIDPPMPHGFIAVGNGIARSRGLITGSEFFFIQHDGAPLGLVVKGTFSENSELMTSDLILLSEGDFRRLFGISSDYVNDLIVTVRNPTERATVARKIKEALPDARPLVKEEIARTYDSVFDWRSGMIIVVLSIALLAFAILAWEKASGLGAEERREIGVLKAVGWDTQDVLLLKLWESAIISLLAFFGGVILAYFHVFLADAGIFGQALKGWSVLYPRFRLTPSVEAYQLVTLFFLTVVPYAAATLIPCWRAASVDPDLVMRSQ